MTIEELVKMPEPAFKLRWNVYSASYSVNRPNIGDTDCYTADQLRAYGEAVAAAVAKRCADLCQQIAYSHQAAPMLGPELNSLNCADAIRREFGDVSNEI